jgi:6,7-dimethyl-8-ribityllumazine synthase
VTDSSPTEAAEAREREDELELGEDERLEEAEHVHELPLDEDPIVQEAEPAEAAEPADEAEPLDEPEHVPEDEPGADAEATPIPQLRAAAEHAEGELDIPDEVALLEGVADGKRRSVAIVAARFNGEITNRLLQSALDELTDAGVRPEAVTVMPVPGAFELPLAAMALAKTRRYACVVALGCVIRGETPHFEYVASEAASGLQLAALETGIPVAFGVLTVDNVEQAAARVAKGAEAARTALEMADAFAQLRASAAAR